MNSQPFFDPYQQREYDFFNGDIEVSIEYADVGLRTVYQALDSLEDNKLIEKTCPIE